MPLIDIHTKSPIIVPEMKCDVSFCEGKNCQQSEIKELRFYKFCADHLKQLEDDSDAWHNWMLNL